MSLESLRSETPDSPGSLRHATATIDDLTLALSDFSRAHSPEPPNITTCCCGKEDCETTKTWCAFKAKLESRLVLSAEVGQALLERHEAYVRRNELARKGVDPTTLKSLEEIIPKRSEEQVDARVAELVRENAVLEKRLSQAFINSEAAEVAHQKVMQELKRANETIGRLSAQNARLIGFEQRLNAAMQEKEDLRQERDSAIQHSRTAESRVISLKEKCSNLQAQVNRLREDMDTQRSHRQGLSEELVNAARQRLHKLQQEQLGHASMDDEEITKVLESLVNDNEALKRDYVELQNILADTREDLRVLQEQVEEHRASDPTLNDRRSGMTSGAASVFNVGTVPTPSSIHSIFRTKSGPSQDRRAVSVERSPRRVFEPLTPQTGHRPWSPAESHWGTEIRGTPLSHRRSTPSRRSFEDEDDVLKETEPASPLQRQSGKPLLLFTRSLGVQTDGTGQTNSLLGPSAMPRAFTDVFSTSSPRDGQSESSSLTDSNTSVLGSLIDRMSHLANRLMQADALTLTNRLKRQNLLGADIGHLSRSTVNSVLQEITTLRAQYRSFLEDEKATTTCTRKDLRGLFRLFKDTLSELGQLRVTLNDVILDPAVADKVSEAALHPSKAGEATASGTSGWIGPFSKLLGLPSSSSNPEQEAAIRTSSPPIRPASRGRPRPPARIVPKREPALSASATTVNVEFSGAGVGRAVTSTYSAGSEDFASVAVSSQSQQSLMSASSSQTAGTLRNTASRNVMTIFAGAPRPVADSADPWIVVPTPQRGASRVRDLRGDSTIGRSTLRNMTVDSSLGHPNRNKRLSRIVDAVIDQDPTQQGLSPTTDRHDEQSSSNDEGRMIPDTLLERTLRPRGLSDSSIHTTFMTHGDRAEPPHSPEPAPLTRQSVLQALSRKVQSFRLASSNLASSIPAPSVPTAIAAAISRPQTPHARTVSNDDAAPSAPRTTSPLPMRDPRHQPSSSAAGLLSSMTGWATSAAALETEVTSSMPQFHAGSPREEPFIGRRWTREGEL